MIIESIKLLNFRNYEELHINFSDKINCFLGDNGAGKTNLLDAVYYLSLTKSAFNSKDIQNISFGNDFFSIKGEFKIINRTHKVICSFNKGQKKLFQTDNQDYGKLSEHIGRFPLVLIAPNDTDIIRDHSEARRKFFDGIISQMNKRYLNDLLNYKQVLKQRNALLKQFAEKKSIDEDLLTPYNLKMVSFGKDIFNERRKFLKRYLPVFTEHYRQLSDDKEEVTIRYESDLLKEYTADTLLKNLNRDLLLQRTSSGIHRDDYKFEISGHQLKRYGSQGQQKSFLIALKMAQFVLIKKEKKFNPILLLDDIFDKLDENRIGKLLNMVSSKSFGQLFITDARAERAKALLESYDFPAKYFVIENNGVNELETVNEK